MFPDAMRKRQGHHGWAIAWILCGFAGLIVMLIGWRFYVSVFAGILVMLVPILLYWRKRNQAVDESQRYYLKLRRDPVAAAARRAVKRAHANATLQFDGPNGSVPVPEKDDPLLLTWIQLEQVLLPSLQTGGSRIDLALGSGGLASARMLHTVRSKQEPLDAEDGVRVVNLLKEIAGLDQQETRRKQIGRVKVSGAHGLHTLDIQLAGSSKGITGRIDIDRDARAVMKPAAIGLLPEQMAIFEALLPEEERHGIILLAAPPGQGLTTTGYAMASLHDAYLSMIKSLELQIEGRLEGVDQVQFDPQSDGGDYATNLQSILRRDPDIVLAHLCDAQTAQAATRAGDESTLQLLMLNAPSAAVAIREWVRMVGDVPTAAKDLRAVMAQRLVRVLCPDCRQAVTPADPKKFGLATGAVIHRAVGEIEVKNRMIECPTCRGAGYNGVTAIFEVLSITPDIRRMLSAGDLKGALSQARRDHMLLLQETGIRRVADGITSIEEIQRVLSPAKRPAPKAREKAT
jgi:type II secretory ATPase GspE/PulE/Tfp pilus assembly ATPase PilB-like protein